MTSQEKKDLIRKKLDAGDKRSYYQLSADLELEIWARRMKGDEWFENKFKKR